MGHNIQTKIMKTQQWNETFEERLVTYTQEVDGRFISPEIVTKIQAIVRARLKPARVIETPVYEFSEVTA